MEAKYQNIKIIKKIWEVVEPKLMIIINQQKI